MTNLPQYCLLSANMERIFAGEQGRSGGGADLLTVCLLQCEASLRQSLQGSGRHVRVVPGHVIVTKVVRQDKNYVRLPILPNYERVETAESEAETLHGSETRLTVQQSERALCDHRSHITLISHHALGQAFVD